MAGGQQPEFSCTGHWATAEEGNAESRTLNPELRSKELSPCIAILKPSCDEVNIWPVGKGEMVRGSSSSITNQSREESIWSWETIHRHFAQMGTPILDLVSLQGQADPSPQ